MTSPSSLMPGVHYHIYNRGTNRENVFIEERNYAYFLRLYSKYIEPVAETYAYCLLRNHFHVFARIRDDRDPNNHGDPKGFARPLGSGPGPGRVRCPLPACSPTSSTPTPKRSTRRMDARAACSSIPSDGFPCSRKHISRAWYAATSTSIPNGMDSSAIFASGPLVLPRASLRPGDAVEPGDRVWLVRWSAWLCRDAPDGH